tara:strand:- start:297 stop:491 length:195 start_codon:yes stop_codon:yes gene_type:complete
MAYIDETGDLVIIWQPEDVISMDKSLTWQEASEVLRALARNHDANDGITWETIEAAIDTWRRKQ